MPSQARSVSENSNGVLFSKQRLDDEARRRWMAVSDGRATKPARLVLEISLGCGSFGRRRRWLGRHCPLRGCSGLTALASAKILRRRTDRRAGVLAPRPGCGCVGCLTGGVADAQPPANGWQASGLRNQTDDLQESEMCPGMGLREFLWEAPVRQPRSARWRRIWGCAAAQPYHDGAGARVAGTQTRRCAPRLWTLQPTSTKKC